MSKNTLTPTSFKNISGIVVTHDDDSGSIRNILKQLTHLLQIDAAQCTIYQSASQKKQIIDYGFSAALPLIALSEQLTTSPSIDFLYIQNLSASSDEPYKAAAAAGFETLIQWPIWSIDNHRQLIGCVALFHTDFYEFTEKDQMILQLMSEQIGRIMKEKELVLSETAARLQAQALQKVTIALTSNLSIESLLDILLEQIVQVIPTDVANLGLVNNDRIVIVKIIGREPFVTPLEKATHMSIEDTPLLRDAISTAKPLLVPDTRLYDQWIWVPESLYVRSWIGIPIYVNHKLEALISLHKAEPNFYTPQQLPILEAFQSQAAVAFHNARLFEKSNRQARELRILNQMSRDLTAVVSLKDICNIVVNCLCQDLGYFFAAVYLSIPPEEQFILWDECGPTAANRMLHQEIQNLRHTSMRPTFQTRATQRYEFKLTAAEQAQHHCTTINGMIIPLQMSESVTGLLCLEYKSKPQEMELVSDLILQTLCDQLITAIEKMRLFENISRYAQEIETLYSLSWQLRELETVDEVLTCAIKCCVQQTQARGGSMMLLEKENGDLVLRALEPHVEQSVGTRYPQGQGIVQHVAATKEIYVAENVLADPLTHIPKGDRPRIDTAKSSISLPILTEGRLIGVLNIWYDEYHYFTKEEKRLLTTLTEIISGAIERAFVLQTLEQRVHERTQELEKANEKLQELDDLKSRFVSEVSHELRTPIANLTLYIDLLKRNKNRPEKHAKYIDVLGKQAIRLENLVDSVLYLSRLDLGQGTFELVPVDINEVIEEVLGTQILRAEAKGVVLTYKATKYSTPSNVWSGISRPLKVLGDRNQLAQLITTLVDNAINYTDEGFIKVQLYKHRDKEVCIEVEDNGCGIPAKEWDHLFNRFYRGAAASQFNIPGNGLGLAIAHEITTIHRGRIDLQSKVGEGTTFFVWLPIITY